MKGQVYFRLLIASTEKKEVKQSPTHTQNLNIWSLMETGIKNVNIQKKSMRKNTAQQKIVLLVL